MDNTFDMEGFVSTGEFYSKSVVRVRSEFSSRTQDIDLINLPRLSSIFFNNTLTGEVTDLVPDPNSIDTFDVPKKMMYHVPLSQLDYSNEEKRSFRVLTQGLIGTLSRYNKDNLKKFRSTKDIDKLESSQEIVTMFNFNTTNCVELVSDTSINRLLRSRVLLRNFIKLMSTVQRNNFIVIDVPDDLTIPIVKITNAVRQSSLSIKTLGNSFTNFDVFLSELSIYLGKDFSNSLFFELPVRIARLTNFIFRGNGKYFIVNLGQLNEMINTTPDLKYLFRAIEDLSSDTVTEVATNKGVMSNVTGSVSDPVTGVINNSSNSSSEDTSNDSSDTNENITLPQPTAEELKFEPEPAMEPSTKSIDSVTELLISKNTDLTPSQKVRAGKISKQYKDIKLKIDGKEVSIEDIINKETPEKLDNTKITHLDKTVMNKDLLNNKVVNMDKQYIKNNLEKDIIMSLMDLQKNGLFLTGLEYEDVNNSLTNNRTMKIKFQDIDGNTHTIKPKIPMPDSEGDFRLDGIETMMVKQMVNLPICRISNTRVNLISNFNKTVVEKTGSSRNDFTSFLRTKGAKFGYKFEFKEQTFYGQNLPYEYKLIGRSILKMDNNDLHLVFNFDDRYELLKVKEDLSKLETKYGVLIGKYKKSYVFLNEQATLVSIKDGKFEDNKSLFDLIFDGDVSEPPYEWCNLQILDKFIPIIFMLSYRYGLTRVLSNLKLNYRFVVGRVKDLKSTELVIPFRNRKLVVDRYPLEGSLIALGLKHYKTAQYDYENFDTANGYYNLLDDKGMSKNYIIGIDNYFDFFIDSKTAIVLRNMNEPTNTRDLLIRAVDMLVNGQDKEPSSCNNFRVRNHEKISAILYNDISRQYANYKSSTYKSKSFSINPEGVYQRIVQDENMVLKSDINPLHDIKMRHKVTYTGFGGRSAESFVERDRKFPVDGVGLLSESTVDSAGAGMTSSLPPNSNIENIHGMFSKEKELTGSSMYSFNSLTQPCVLNDDVKRTVFSDIQASHIVPCESYRPSRICTEGEKVAAQMTGKKFIVKGEGDGKIVDIDDTDKLIRVKYKDGTTRVYEYGDIVGKDGDSRYNHHLVLTKDFKVGQSIKEGEVIAYNTGFFELDLLTGEPRWCHGIPARIAINVKDSVEDDSNEITQELADLLSFNPVYVRTMSMSTDMNITSYMKVGDTVDYDTELIVTEYDLPDEIASDENDLFLDLRSKNYISKNKGVIKAIRVFSSSEELSDSIKKFASVSLRKSKSKGKFSKGTQEEGVNTPAFILPVGARLDGKTIGENEFIVQYEIYATQDDGVGDKIIFDSSLKTVTGHVVPSMRTEDNRPLHGSFSGHGVFNRTVLSPIKQGIVVELCIDAEKEIVKIWES